MKIKRGDGLNVVPFIDVMLVLLALVLSISTFVSQGKIKVEVPSASNTEQVKDEKDSVTLVIDKEDKIYINDEEITEEALGAFLQNIPNDKLVYFKGDKHSSLDRLVFVIDHLTKKGHDNDKFRIDTQRN